MNIVAFCRRNSYAVYLLTAFLTLAGFLAVFQLPSNIYPELNFPRVVILAHSGDLAPDTMLLNITRPLEEASSSVLGAWRIRSKTIRGNSEISITFNPDMDMQYALQLVQGRVSAVRSSLPADTEIEVERVTPAVFPVLDLVLNGDVPGADLRDYAYYVLRPLLTRVPGVGLIEVQASDVREVSVIVDPQRMLAHRISLVDVSNELKATNQVTSVGRLQKDYAQYLVLNTSQFTSLDDVRNSVAAIENGTPIRVGDIAEVRDGVEDHRLLVTGNGKPAALINITRQIGGSILQMTSQIKDMMGNLGSAIPKTLHLTVTYDLAEFVSESIGSVRDAILIGTVLAVLILFGFLRDGRTTLVAATSLPLSVIGTFFFLKVFNGTLNLMSLGGLAIAIGIIIDDAVVIIENIYRHLGLGESPAEAAEKGTRELLGAVVGSTATTLVVFLPLGLLKGWVGEFFSALCLTLGISILLSLVFALTVIPLLSLRFLSAGTHRTSSEGFIAPVNRAYERAVRWSLGHRGIVAIAVLVSVAVGATAFAFGTKGYLPEMDEGGYVLDYLTPPGTSLQQTDLILRQVEARIAAMPETGAFSRRTGAELGLYVTLPNKGDLMVKMKPLCRWPMTWFGCPASERRRSTQEVMDDLRDQINKNIPGIDVEFSQILQDQIGDLEVSPEPVEVKLFGNNMPALEQLADEIQPRLEKIPGLVDFKGIQKGNPELVFHVDPSLAGRAGLTAEQVSQQVSAGLLGINETELRQADRTIPIRVRFPDSFRGDYNNIVQFPLVDPAKQIVPLSLLAQVERVQGESQLLRENQRLMVTITARLLENRDLGSAIADVQKVMHGVSLPVGTTYEIGGQYESQQSSFHDLLKVLGLALAAVFVVLVIQFHRFTPALIILSAAPLSLVGVFLMLWVSGTALNVSSFMGIILMVGLVVKNGIILFEYVNKLWDEEKLPLHEALVAAGKIRIRPILMTTLATLFGLLPLALGLGSGAELQKPLALAVIGGLLLSTFITLLVMPVLYSLLDRTRETKTAS
ncbi:MAG TPA: efflux RND transporter permease subunit [Candidatus Acidoferrales bacterium]|jgi:CzcA family heavy metal efflux pump|nr:efflux RND transporter permease subunit [Candidatus Acidoferrales bacterium]